MKINIKIICALFLGLLLPGLSNAEVVNSIVAKVNGDIITLSELKKHVYRSIKSGKNAGEKELDRAFKKNKKKALDKIIEETLMLQYAKLREIAPSKDDIDNAIEDIKKNNDFSDEMMVVMLRREGMTLEQYRGNLRNQITLSKVFGAEIRSRIQVNEKEVAAYYNKNKEKFLNPGKINAYHILFSVIKGMDKYTDGEQRKKALAVLKLAKMGEDFGELAGKYSEGPSKDLGGDLGWIKKGEMIPEFEKAAFLLKKGEISGLVKTGYGYHIIKIEDIKKPTPKTLEDTRDEIRNILRKQKQDEKYISFIADLKKDSFIEIYLNKKRNKRRYVSLIKNKRSHKTNRHKSRPNGKIRNKKRKTNKEIVKKENKNNSYQSVRLKEKINISKFILNWKNARETKNRRRYFSFYSKDFKINGLNREEWKKKTLEEYGNYKFIKIEIRGMRIFKRDNYYVVTFDQRIKSNIDDQIRLVRLYLTKNKKRLLISKEKWLNSPYSEKEFSQRPLLSLDTLPRTPTTLSKKRKKLRVIQPLGFNQ